MTWNTTASSSCGMEDGRLEGSDTRRDEDPSLGQEVPRDATSRAHEAFAPLGVLQEMLFRSQLAKRKTPFRIAKWI